MAETKTYERNCPTCSKILTYSSRQHLWRAKKTNATCKPCFYKKRKWPSVRVCLHCKKELKYKNRRQLNKATRNATWCRSCSKKEAFKNPEYARKISIAHQGKILSTETKRKLRIATLQDKQNKHGQLIPNYNKLACQIFEKVNEEFGWKGQHAENGGEYHIKELGYWVDYYEPNLNLVIEYDEERHKQPKRKEKDKQRQEEIEEYLGCTFIRIKESDSSISI